MGIWIWENRGNVLSMNKESKKSVWGEVVIVRRRREERRARLKLDYGFRKN